MFYVSLAVVFYTAVKFAFEVWLQFRREIEEDKRRAFGLKTEYPDN